MHVAVGLAWVLPEQEQDAAFASADGSYRMRLSNMGITLLVIVKHEKKSLTHKDVADLIRVGAPRDLPEWQLYTCGDWADRLN